MKRQFDPAVPELMDRPQPISPELEIDLHNLRQLNRYFGSYALVRHFLRRWINSGDMLRVLDLATGSGDIPRLIVQHGRDVGASVNVTAVDQQPATLEIARRLSREFDQIEFIKDDALTFTPTEPFDIVVCSLALHHFSDEGAIAVLRRCRELSRRYVLVADLCRSLFTTVGVHLLTGLIFREPMTRVDGRLSAARAFSFSEMAALARRAGWANCHHARFRFGRQAIWME
ncbi:MAG: methyltransferase domain-containing protein [Chthoniobacterales bacterium]